MKKLKQDIKNGTDKREAFESIVKRNGNLKKASRYLASLPELAIANRYKTANNILIALYATLNIITLLFLIPSMLSWPIALLFLGLAFSAVLPACVIYLIYKNSSKGYFLLMNLSILGLSRVIRGYIEDPTGT